MEAACGTAIAQVPCRTSLQLPSTVSCSFGGRRCIFVMEHVCDINTKRIINSRFFANRFCVKASQPSVNAHKGNPIRIGVLGCANIARKISRAISLVATDAIIYAVASRTLDKASNFVAANNLPSDAKLYGSYKELLDDPDVEAVYLPLPTALHLKWAVLAAKKKKHILLEKPVALSLVEFDQVLEACESNGVQLMDGTMWVHNPRTAKMEDFLRDEAEFGQLKNIQAVFSFAASDEFLQNDIRVKPELDALGALGDAGWYCIRAMLLASNYEVPKVVTALRGSVANDAGVILSCGASLLWPNGTVGTFQCSFLSHLTMDITAIGTKGTLRVTDFIIPQDEHVASFSTTTNTCFRDMETGWSPMPSVHTITTELPQEAYMVKEFARLIRYPDADRRWAIISRKTQAVLDAVKASIEKGCEPVEVVF